MKVLLVLNAGDGAKSVADAQKRLAAQCEAMGCAWDTYLYGGGDLAGFASDCGLAGLVRHQQTRSVCPGAVAAAIQSLARAEGYGGVLIADGGQAPVLAGLIGASGAFSALTGVSALRMEKSFLQCRKPVYNNNLIGCYSLRLPFVVSEKLPRVRAVPSCAEPLRCAALPALQTPAFLLSEFVAERQTGREPSPVLLVAGMGVGERADVERIRAFSGENGFTFGVTRPVAMRGWGGMEEIVGVSGGIYAPKVTVTLGVSGSAAFFVGIEQSEYILAVNTNPSANIAALCDALITDDYRQILAPLCSRLRAYRQEALCARNDL